MIRILIGVSALCALSFLIYSVITYFKSRVSTKKEKLNKAKENTELTKIDEQIALEQKVNKELKKTIKQIKETK